ncbi:vitellogenin-A2-like [Dermacentor albipictus]|uniref:vitellogenin-A2-like n=1 Tax=Dermacentor albipictus TaxID=60249 RepID=UPI0038FCE534
MHGAKRSSDSIDGVQITPEVGTADVKQARSKDSRLVSPAPKKPSVATTTGGHSEAGTRSSNPSDGFAAASLDGASAALPQHSRPRKKNLSSSTSKASLTTSSTSKKRPRTAELQKTAQLSSSSSSSSSVTPGKEQEPQVSSVLQSNAAESTTKPKPKHEHTG